MSDNMVWNTFMWTQKNKQENKKSLQNLGACYAQNNFNAVFHP